MRGAHSQDPRPAAASRLSSSHSAARDPKSAYKCIFTIPLPHSLSHSLATRPCGFFPHGLVICRR